jgi:hypothetical protein
MGNASALAGFLLLLGVATTPVGAQSLAPEGTYSRLSAGNQKIALALFDAQQAHVMPSSGGASTGGATTGAPSSNSVIAPAPATASTTPAAKPMTLDQIAAQKQSGHAWGEIFQTMRDQGLVQEKNLGQVVSRYQRPSTAATAATAAKGK